MQIQNLAVSLSKNADGSFEAQFSDGLGFNFDQQDFYQFCLCFDQRQGFFFQALQAFINNNLDPRTATKAQIKTLLEAQSYIGLQP